MRRMMLLLGAVAVAFVLVSATAGYWVLREQATASDPTGELVFTRQAEAYKVTSLDGIVTLAVFPADLYVVGVDGSDRRLLARNAADAAVSPDGRRIAFTRGGAVWIMQRDGSRAIRLVKAAREPAWSPDGTTIYFSRWVKADLGTSLFSIRDDGTRLVRLTRAKGQEDMDPLRPHGCWQHHQDPSPSPDGRSVAFTDEADVCGSENDIRAVSPDGRQTLRLPFRLLPDGVEVSRTYAAAWSPDGRQLAYGGWNSRPSEAGLYVSRSDGSPTREIAAEDPWGSPPAWSPKSEWIAFVVSSEPWPAYPANSRIELVRADGSHQHTLTRPTPCADADPSTPTPPTRCSSYYDPAWLPAPDKQS